MSAIGSQLQQEYPKDNAGRNVMLVPLAHTVVPASQRTMYVRAGLIASTIVAVVLLIACSNVAHLLLARASERRQEFSIRMAIGASRRDVVGQLLVEGLLLACVACTFGLLLAYAVRDVATALMPGNLRANLDYTLDGRVLLFTAGTSALSTVMFAFGPALRARSIGTFHPVRARLAALARGRCTSPFGGRSVRSCGGGARDGQSFHSEPSIRGTDRPRL
jgi:hypothetical protein